jgi:AraC family transcriptional regulator
MPAAIKQNSLSEYKMRIAKVLDYIEKNIDKKLSLQILSHVSCFSQFHFHRVFLSIIGETPNEFVNRLRLEKAANILILKKHIPITEVALSLGFSSSSSFARAFKEQFNYTASDWREFGYNTLTQQKSKIRKTFSNNGKEFDLSDNEFYSVDNLFSELEERSDKMNIEIKHLPKLHIAYVIHTEGYNEKIEEAFTKLCRWAGPRRLINQHSSFIGISLDDPDITPVEKCRYYACITISQEIETQGEIHKMELPAGEYAVYHFEGKDTEIKTAYKNLFGSWLPQSGFQPADSPCYEIYLNEPDKDPERKFVFDICLPVKPL